MPAIVSMGLNVMNAIDHAKLMDAEKTSLTNRARCRFGSLWHTLSIACLNTIQYKRSAIRFAVVTAYLFFPFVARADYDAELDIGLVASDPSPTTAASNTAKLNAALAAMHAGGSFTFAVGHPHPGPNSGPVLEEISFAAKNFAIVPPIKTAPRTGGGMHGVGGRTNIYPDSAYSAAGPYGGAVTRLSAIGGDGEDVIVLCGSGFRLRGFQINGRRWINAEKGGTFAPGRARSAIAVEGRGGIYGTPTCFNTIEDITIQGCRYGILALSDFTRNDGTRQPFENNADQLSIERVSFWGVESCYRSLNQQAVGSSGRDWSINAIDNKEVTVLDIMRGGNFTLSNPVLNAHQVVLINLRDYSQNNARITVSDFKWDFGMERPLMYLTLVKYSGRPQGANAFKWGIRITGHMPRQSGYAKARLIEAGAAPTDDWWFDITGMPTEGMERIGSFWKVKTN
jgi:hypothetical protein